MGEAARMRREGPSAYSGDGRERESTCKACVCVLEGGAGGCQQYALRGEFVTMARLDPLICSWEQLFVEKPWLSCLLCLW